SSGRGISHTIRWDCLNYFWDYFHPSFPVVHRPTFFPKSPSPLLSGVMLAIGSLFDMRPDAEMYSLALQEIVSRLLKKRKIAHNSRMTDLQTVFLLEILSKYHARQIDVQTSTRFRQLYASLYSARASLANSPLAIFKTQSNERTQEDIRRAHKYWIDHETKRRIFHACSVLDLQQVALFEERATIQVHSSKLSVDTSHHIHLPCAEDLWNASPEDEWAGLAESALSQSVKDARATYATASVSDYSFFQHSIISASPDGLHNLRCSDELVSPPNPNVPLSRTRFNYHVFQMSNNIPVRELLIVAGESWFLGRKVEQELDYDKAKQTVRQWVEERCTISTTKDEKDVVSAHWHALRVLRMLVNHDEIGQALRTTNMLHEDWATYLAALVCWARGYGSSLNRKPSTVHSCPAGSVPLSPMLSQKRKFIDAQSSRISKRHASMSSTTSAIATPVVAQTSATPVFARPQTPQYQQVYSPYNSLNFIAPVSPAQIIPSQPTSLPKGHYVFTPPPPRPSQPRSFIPSAVTSPQTTPSSTADTQHMKAYLSATDVAHTQFFTPQALSLDVLSNTTGLLNVIRLHKIGKKDGLGGLMNNASKTLERLAWNRPGLF
ncbi:hypothetical protein LTR66_015336, partial [Elasticomyces elasticus]